MRGEGALSKMIDQAHDQAQKDRETVFSNESFAIGVFQAVSGAALFAGISQSTTLITLAGAIAFLTFITLMGFGLASAVLAAYCKHEYKLWEVLYRGGNRSEEERDARVRRANRYLKTMRGCMLTALLTFALGLAVLLGSSWIHVLAPASAAQPPATHASPPATHASPPTTH